MAAHWCPTQFPDWPHQTVPRQAPDRPQIGAPARLGADWPQSGAPYIRPLGRLGTVRLGIRTALLRMALKGHRRGWPCAGWGPEPRHSFM
jgi:hypothetical protein